jgi:hypothetical protein
MKRILLLIVIIGMCILVAIGGTITFVNSNSILKQDKGESTNKAPKDLRIFVDITENKMYLLSEGKVIKTYPVSTGKYNSPSPIGDWIIVGKDTWGEGFGGRWMAFNVPWGKYGIHGTNEPWSIGAPLSHGCIRMRNKDVAELYKIVHYGTPVKIYGGPFGPFGTGFRIIKPGDRGSDVYEVQKRLKEKGYFKGYVNGIYGQEMENAVHQFQKKNGLPVSNYIGYSFYNKLGIVLFD